jgi:hypothetical protein
MPSKLPTRKVGNTEVSAIGYGAMGISSYYGAAPPDEERFKVIPVPKRSRTSKREHFLHSCLMLPTRLGVPTGTLQMCTVTRRSS